MQRMISSSNQKMAKRQEVHGWNQQDKGNTSGRLESEKEPYRAKNPSRVNDLAYLGGLARPSEHRYVINRA